FSSRGLTPDITRSINLPIERMPAPCIRRLRLAGFPQSSGKTRFTADQKTTSTVQMPSTSVSPVAMFRYGKRQPDVEVMLSSTIFTTDVSATMPFSFELSEALRISLWNGDVGVWFSHSQTADGSLRAAIRDG